MRADRKGGAVSRIAQRPQRNPGTSIGVDRRTCHAVVHHSANGVPVHDEGLFALGRPLDLLEPRPSSGERGFGLLDGARITSTLGLVQIGFERLDR